jgi:hypothetical protein
MLFFVVAVSYCFIITLAVAISTDIKEYHYLQMKKEKWKMQNHTSLVSSMNYDRAIMTGNNEDRGLEGIEVPTAIQT